MTTTLPELLRSNGYPEDQTVAICKAQYAEQNLEQQQLELERARRSARNTVDAEELAESRTPLAFLSDADLDAIPPFEWLLQPYLVRDSLAVLYGPSEGFK